MSSQDRPELFAHFFLKLAGLVADRILWAVIYPLALTTTSDAILVVLKPTNCWCVGILPFLVLASVSLDDGVAPLILQLLQCALCGSKAIEQSSKSGNTGTTAGSTSSAGGSTSSATSAVSPAKSKREDRTETKSNADVKKKEGNKAGANSDCEASLNYGVLITSITLLLWFCDMHCISAKILVADYLFVY